MRKGDESQELLEMPLFTIAGSERQYPPTPRPFPANVLRHIATFIPLRGGHGDQAMSQVNSAWRATLRKSSTFGAVTLADVSDMPASSSSGISIASLRSPVWSTLKARYMLLAVVVGTTILFSPIMEANPPAHRCLALIAYVVVLWVTEAIPLFCTGLFVPLFAIMAGIIPNTTPQVASIMIIGVMFSRSQVLILGVLTFSAAVAKFSLERDLGRLIHAYTAHRPNMFLLTMMVTGVILSGFLSNVTAPVLMLGVLRPTLHSLPQDGGGPQAILLALAFSCNLGGMLTPIASPQNAVAMNVLQGRNLSFLKWIGLALPVVILGLLSCWGFILFWWKPFKDLAAIPPLPRDRYHGVSIRTKLTNHDVRVVLGVITVTILLWIFVPLGKSIYGDEAIVALIPVVVFFGLGILTKEDFNNLSWHLMFLLAGANMIGLCAKQSNLLEVLASSLKPYFAGQSTFTVFTTLLGFMAMITPFVSHTMSALILLPFVSEVASEKGGDVTAFVFCAVIMCSGAMCLSISSLPNINSLLAEDRTGNAYLTTRQYFIPGLLMMVIVFVVTLVIVYPLGIV